MRHLPTPCSCDLMLALQYAASCACCCFIHTWVGVPCSWTCLYIRQHRLHAGCWIGACWNRSVSRRCYLLASAAACARVSVSMLTVSLRQSSLTSATMCVVLAMPLITSAAIYMQSHRSCGGWCHACVRPWTRAAHRTLLHCLCRSVCKALPAVWALFGGGTELCCLSC
jgi:hypothetical protein